MKTGIELIAAERQRQIEEEGYTPEHDLFHEPNDFVEAAIAYLMVALGTSETGQSLWWPWDKEYFKPSDNKIRNLEKVGALTAAAIDRINAERAICTRKEPVL